MMGKTAQYSVINLIPVGKLITLGADVPSKSPVGSSLSCRHVGKVMAVVTNLVHPWENVVDLALWI